MILSGNRLPIFEKTPSGSWGNMPLWNPSMGKPSFEISRGMRLNPDHPLNKGLVAWWLFNERTGRIVDIVNGLKGTLTNSPAWSGDQLNFIGASTQYVEVPNNSAIQFGNTPCSVLVEGGVSSVSFSDYRTFIGKDNLNTYTECPWWLGTFGTSLAFKLRHSGATLDFQVTSALAANVNYRIGITINYAGFINGYKNGALIGTPTDLSGYTWGTSSSTGVLRMGMISYTSAYKLDGFIKQVLLYKRELSAQDMVLWNARPYGTPSQPRLIPIV